MIKKYLPLCLIMSLIAVDGLMAQTAGTKKTPVKASTTGLVNPTAKAAQPSLAILRTASGSVDVSKIDPIKLTIR